MAGNMGRIILEIFTYTSDILLAKPYLDAKFIYWSTIQILFHV